ncbi:hypothetical protein [Streptomyces sp. NPDC088733]|uniref:hypothetical protein n=1 Tax=Streptomyces sp. NPDC088733 TaxID=3365880 RepID=UPI003810C523
MTTTPPKRVLTLTERLDQHDHQILNVVRDTLLLQKEMRHINEARLPQQVMEMSRIIRDVADTVKRRDEEGPDETKPWNWATMTATEQAEAWAVLLQWRREVLKVRFPQAYNKMLAPCWYRHPDVVEELSALYVSWSYAYVDKERSAFRAADFLDRRLPFTTQRVVELLATCSSYEGATHQEPQPKREEHDDAELSDFLLPLHERAQQEEQAQQQS